MIREEIIRKFQSLSKEEQIKEYQQFRALGDFSPLTEDDYFIMESFIENPDVEIALECTNGICKIKEPITEEIESLDDTDLEELLEATKTKKVKNPMSDFILELLSERHVRDYLRETKAAPLYKRVFTNLKLLNTKDETKNVIKELMDELNLDTKTTKMGWKKNILSNSRYKQELEEYFDISETDGGKISLHLKSGTDTARDIAKADKKDTKLSNFILVVFIYDLIYKTGSNKVKFINKFNEIIETVNINPKLVEIDDALDSIETVFSAKEESVTGTIEVIDINSKKAKDANAYTKAVFKNNKSDVTFDEEKAKKSVTENYSIDTADTNLNYKIEGNLILIKRLSILKAIKYIKNENEISSELIDILLKLEDIEPFNIKLPAPADIKSHLNKAYEIMKNGNITDATINKEKYKKVLSEMLSKLLLETIAADGRGEKFIEFIYPYAVNGGQKSFDIRIGKQPYEVKSYAVDTNNKKIDGAIRLGQEGSVFKSRNYLKLFALMNDLKIVFDQSKKNNKLIQVMLGSAITNKRANRIRELLFGTKNKNSSPLINLIQKGEISAGSINKIQEIFKILKLAFSEVAENDFYFIKLYLKDSDINLAMRSVDSSEITDIISQGSGELKMEISTIVDTEMEKDVTNAVLRILSNMDVIQKEGAFIRDLANEAMNYINKEFERHPMILIQDYNKISDTESPCVGVFTKFEFNTISQNGFKIIPAGFSTTRFTKKGAK